MEIYIEDKEKFLSKTQKTKFKTAVRKAFTLEDSEERQKQLDDAFGAIHYENPDSSYESFSLVDESDTVKRVFFKTKSQVNEKRINLLKRLKNKKMEFSHTPDDSWRSYNALKNHTKHLPTPIEVQENKEMFTYLCTTLGKNSPIASYFKLCLGE